MSSESSSRDRVGRSSRRRLPCLLLTALALLLGSGSAAAQDGQIIQDVIIEGRADVDLGLLEANLRTRPGREYDRSHVDEDIRWMHDNYGILVEDVIVDPGPVVRFRLQRILQYAWVRIEGNDRFSDSTLRGVSRLRENQPATPDQVVKARGLVADHYLKRGHAFVQVDVRQSEDEAGRRGARILVFEGPEVEIDEVSIEGLTALDVDDALDILRSTPGFWSWLVGKDFVEADLDRDIVLLETFVRGEGYLDGEVSVAPLSWNEDRDEVDVTFLVEEGERYVVGDLVVEGNSALDTDALLKDAALKPGGFYRTHDRARVVRAIRGLYGEIGHLDIRVQVDELYDLDSPRVDLKLVVQEGLQKRVRDIIVRGNSNTRDGVVRRYLTIYPGDVADLREIRYSEDALVALDYFADLAGTPKVRVSTEPTGDPGYVDVVVDVEDSSSGLFSFVVGAASDDGLFGGITVDKRNFDISRPASTWGRFFTEFFGSGEAYHGGGQRLYMELVPGTDVSTFDVTFQDPWLDESREDPWGVSVQAYKRRRFFSDYDQDTDGVAVLLDHRFSRESSISFGPRLERVEISNVEDRRRDSITGEQSEYAKAEDIWDRHVIEGGWRYQDLDSLYEPTEGFITRIRLENVGGPLGGDVDVVRLEYGNEWYVPMGEDEDGHMRVFHPRFTVGVLGETSGDEQPFFENFFVGGASGPFAVRGFDFQGIGPHQGVVNTNKIPGGGVVLIDTDGEPIGGEMALAGSLEAVFPLVAEYNPFRDRDEILVKGVLFIDYGNLREDVDLGKLFEDLRVSAGTGVRLRLPALGGVTLLLDWATPLRKEDVDDTRPLSFELSRRF